MACGPPEARVHGCTAIAICARRLWTQSRPLAGPPAQRAPGRLLRRRVDAVVDLRKEVVALFHGAEPGLVEASGLELLVEPGEAEQSLLAAADSVVDHGAGLDDERPVRGLRQQELARGLVEGAPLRAARVGEEPGQLDHPLRGLVRVAGDP